MSFFLKHLWRLKFIAEKYNLSATSKSIDVLITQNPEGISEDDWKDCQDILENKKTQMAKRY